MGVALKVGGGGGGGGGHRGGGGGGGGGGAGGGGGGGGGGHCISPSSGLHNQYQYASSPPSPNQQTQLKWNVLADGGTGNPHPIKS